MASRKFEIVVRAMALMMALVLAAPTSGLGQLAYFCSMTGEVGERCCCRHEAEKASPDGPTMSAAPCCEIFNPDEQLQPTRFELKSPEFETPEFVALPTASDDRIQVRKPTRVALPHGARGPPPDTGPPLFIQNCSFLI
jgi:hypothetical protein